MKPVFGSRTRAGPGLALAPAAQSTICRRKLAERLFNGGRLLDARGAPRPPPGAPKGKPVSGLAEKDQTSEGVERGGEHSDQHGVGWAAPLDAWTQWRLNPEPKPNILADYRSQ